MGTPLRWETAQVIDEDTTPAPEDLMADAHTLALTEDIEMQRATFLSGVVDVCLPTLAPGAAHEHEVAIGCVDSGVRWITVDCLVPNDATAGVEACAAEERVASAALAIEQPITPLY